MSVEAGLQELEKEFEGKLPEGETEPELTEEDKDYEERARRMGWKPQAEYRGRPDGWVDARTFVARSEQELPILRERFRTLDSRLVNTERELTSTKQQLEETNRRLGESREVLVELRDMSRSANEQGYRRALRDIQERQAKAVAEADVSTYQRLEQEREALEQSKPKAAAAPVEPPKTDPPVQPPVAPNPVVEAWVAENPWYGQDQLLTVYAMEMDRDVEAQHKNWALTDKLAEVKKRVVAKFPEKFGAPSAPPPPLAPKAPPGPQRVKGRTVKDLPADAKEALAKFKRTIPGFTDEEFLSQYVWEE